jgi:hypothetical protein
LLVVKRVDHPKWTRAVNQLIREQHRFHDVSLELGTGLSAACGNNHFRWRRFIARAEYSGLQIPRKLHSKCLMNTHNSRCTYMMSRYSKLISHVSWFCSAGLGGRRIFGGAHMILFLSRVRTRPPCLQTKNKH